MVDIRNLLTNIQNQVKLETDKLVEMSCTKCSK